MAEYAFSNGKVRVERDVTLRSGRWQPHALRPAFILLDLSPAPDPDEQRPDETQEAGHDNHKDD